MIALGTQYYRPPFPEQKYWDDDMRRMRDAGLNAVQLWVLWSWVESVPGRFRFDDYDRLVELAGKHGLGVVLSTIAEVQPLWIHREAPGSELVTHLGHKVNSSARCECHFGLTPGGCTDNPAVWERMSLFLRKVAEQYRGASNLLGWDAWNELRWNVHAIDRVCYCEYTLRAFRAWLDRKYGGLEGLNRAWLRRYGQWDEVLPGKHPGLPFTEHMAFCHFLTARACEHAAERYAVIKGIDPDRPVTLHGGAPSAEYSGSEQDQALNRGNDWFFADKLDGVGTSSFPKWFHIDDADFGIRVEFVKSAARGKHVWLSELQGGRSATGFEVHDPVDAASQQRWIWNGLACGADTILFWCWRDEVFCREAGGYGLTGRDGLAEERLAAMRVTGEALARHGALLTDYEPARGEVGILFSPQTYYHHWAVEYRAKRAHDALMGYARALVRESVPYVVVEEEHLDALDGLKILFMPRVTATSPELEAALEAFVRQGGTLVCESECGAFTPSGLYRDPEDRFLARLTGRTEVGRRKLDAPFLAVQVNREQVEVDVTQWLTPFTPGAGRVLASGAYGELVADVPKGQGRVVLLGSYMGEEYFRRQHAADAAERSRCSGFERLVEALVRSAGWSPEFEIVEPVAEPERFLYVKTGIAQGRRLVFVFFQPGHKAARLRFRQGFFSAGTVLDLLTQKTHKIETAADGRQELQIAPPGLRFAVLAEAAE